MNPGGDVPVTRDMTGEEWVRALHDGGWRQAIASSSPTLNVEVIRTWMGSGGAGSVSHEALRLDTGEGAPYTSPVPVGSALRLLAPQGHTSEVFA